MYRREGVTRLKTKIQSEEKKRKAESLEIKEVYEAHVNRYSCPPAVMFSAPGLFHLIGEHSWFFRDKTLSMAQDMNVYVAVSRRKDNSIHFYFHQLGDSKVSTLQGLRYRKEDKWANPLRAVMLGYMSSGYTLGGMNVTVYSEVLPQSGFGITTAVKVAWVYAIRKVLDISKCTDGNILKILELANKLYLKKDNRIADNYVAMFAEDNTLMLTDYKRNCFDAIPFDLPDYTVLLIDTNVPKVKLWDEDSITQSANVLLLGDLKKIRPNVYGGWIYENQESIINEVLSVVDKDTRRRLIGIMNEHKCVLDAIEALVGDSSGKVNIGHFMRSINCSFMGLQGLYDYSCPEIDWVVKRMLELDENQADIRNPTICARTTGKGLGRCVYAILKDKCVGQFYEKFRQYEKLFGLRIVSYRVKTRSGVKEVFYEEGVGDGNKEGGA